jgi:hypothetical protein
VAKLVWARKLLVLIFVLSFLLPAAAFEWISTKGSVFLFAGNYRSGTFPGLSMLPFAGEMESNYLVGGAYDVPLANLGHDIIFGAEVGLAGRFGSSHTSGEIWGGGSFRYVGMTIGDVTIIPGIVVGLSSVTNSIGVEQTREQQWNGNAKLLFYLGPELAFRFQRLPNWEFVVRTHHRSGGEGTLGRMAEGHNANIFGVRIRF